MELFYNISYSVTVGLEIVTFVTLLYIVLKKKANFNALPKGLRLFFIISFFPFSFLYCISTFVYGMLYLINQSENILTIYIVALFYMFSAQTIRNLFFIFAIERIVATVYLERYNLAERILLFWILFSFSMISSFLYVAAVCFGTYSPVFSGVINLYVTAVHIFTLIICSVLHILSKRMYNITAYRITLKKRHQIMKNIKILSFIFPSMLIYTFLIFFASLATNIFYLFNFPPLPASLYHFFNNFAILIIILRHKCMKVSKIRPMETRVVEVTVIENAFGKNLPAAMTSEEYFNDLKKQWN